MPQRATTMNGMLTECRKVTCHTSVCLFALTTVPRAVKHHPIRVEKQLFKRSDKQLKTYLASLERDSEVPGLYFQDIPVQSLAEFACVFLGGNMKIHHGCLWNLVNTSFRSWFLESASFLSGPPKSKVPDGGTLEFRILVTWHRYQAVEAFSYLPTHHIPNLGIH